MLSTLDAAQEEASDFKIVNGATLRCLLALRHVLFPSTASAAGLLPPDFRAVVQLSAPSPYVEAACFQDGAGREVVRPMDLSTFLNSLMFSCAAQPGLSRVLLELLNYDGVALRCRVAGELKGPDGGAMAGRAVGDL